MSEAHVEFDAVSPLWVVAETPIPNATPSVGVAAVSCGNPECPSGCHNVAMMIVLPGQLMSFRYSTNDARELAAMILGICNDQDAKAKKGLN